MYFGGGPVRLEISMDGGGIILVGDPSAGSMVVLMPDQQIYMPLDPAMAPVTPPRLGMVDVANPCSTGELTGCQSLGTEQVNGYDTAVWQYSDSDGETWNAWIATDLGFPVRLIDEEGTTTDFTNIALGPQDPSLFEIPAGYTSMGGGFAGAFGGRGGGAGGGGAGGNPGAPPAGFGFPPGFDPAAFGLDPASVADQLAAIDAYDTDLAAQWEAGDGWLVQYTITASGESSFSGPEGNGTTESTATYSIEYNGQIPLNYGAGGNPGQSGPRWQLVPGIGSDRGNAAVMTFTAQGSYAAEGVHQEACSGLDSGFPVYPYTWTTTTSGALEWNGGPATSDNPNAMGAVAYMQISADLQTYELVVAVGGNVTETSETVTTYGPCPPEAAFSETQNGTAMRQYSGGISLQGLPLPATRSTITETRTVPMQFQVGDFDGELDATIQFTISPI
jgi:hypothetical protein